MAENTYQSGFIKRLKLRFPGCEVIKNDPQYIQGFPDWTMFYGPFWATLEIKAHRKAAHRPNQDYYVEKLSEMGGYSVFVYPENEEEVLTALEEAFASRGAACLPQS